jgi:hypothetical protein
MKFFIKVVYKMSSKHDFRANGSVSHTLLRRANELLLVLSVFVDRTGSNSAFKICT